MSQVSEKTIDIVKGSINVDPNGDVSFRTRTGRGSGAPFKIGSDQFEEFVKLMEEVKNNKSAYVQTEEATSQSTNDSDGN